jgi:hypothetical protein
LIYTLKVFDFAVQSKRCVLCCSAVRFVFDLLNLWFSPKPGFLCERIGFLFLIGKDEYGKF